MLTETVAYITRLLEENRDLRAEMAARGVAATVPPRPELDKLASLAVLLDGMDGGGEDEDGEGEEEQPAGGADL